MQSVPEQNVGFSHTGLDRRMANVLISLGSNVGCREENLQRGVDLLHGTPGIQVEGVSGWLATRAVGGPTGQPDFLNGAALLRTSLSPEALLARLQEIEAQLGRVRTERWGPRTLDLDILLYDDLVIETDRLRIPHPAMTWRRFVLAPAACVAGWMVHPEIGRTVQELLDHLREAFPYAAAASPWPGATTRLARLIAERSGADLLSLPSLVKAVLGRRRPGDEEQAPSSFAQREGDVSPDAGESQERVSSVLRWRRRPWEALGRDGLTPDAALADPTQTPKIILKWLSELAEQSAALRGRSAPDGWVVSDFWLPQWLTWANTILGPLVTEEDRKRWETVCQRIVSPKLLVYFDEGASGPASAGQKAKSEESFGLPPLEKLVRSVWRGPLLRLRLTEGAGQAELAQAAAEVQIAMQSMD